MKTLEIHKDNKKIYDILLDRSYDGLLNKMEQLNIRGRRICIITDSHVAPLYLAEIEALCQQIGSHVIHFIFEAGESSKNLTVIEKIYERLIQAKFDRNDVLIALGGGVTGDMTGFAAATYLRGIRFIQLPTTLLAQVDSSIGGKTGVDFQQYKNMVGAFHQPILVYMNLKTLDTLDTRQFNAGMAEVIKHGLIKNRDYFNWIRNNHEKISAKDYSSLEYMIYESCLVKGHVVEIDPLEKGERALLNFGHTIGHAVEKLKNFEWLHGECVALGSIAASAISLKKNKISQNSYNEIIDLFRMFNLPITVTNLKKDAILEATKSDKKMDGGHVKFILLNEIGDAYIDRTLSDEEITSGIGACSGEIS